MQSCHHYHRRHNFRMYVCGALQNLTENGERKSHDCCFDESQYKDEIEIRKILYKTEKSREKKKNERHLGDDSLTLNNECIR